MKPIAKNAAKMAFYTVFQPEEATIKTPEKVPPHVMLNSR
jgi:hypothetical protein